MDVAMGIQFLWGEILKKGNLIWEAIFKSQITALVFSKEHSSIIFALSEGKIGAIASINGQIKFMDEVIIDGVPSVIMSLSYYNSNIATGTVDGMLLHYKVWIRSWAKW